MMQQPNDPQNQMEWLLVSLQEFIKQQKSDEFVTFSRPAPNVIEYNAVPTAFPRSYMNSHGKLVHSWSSKFQLKNPFQPGMFVEVEGIIRHDREGYQLSTLKMDFHQDFFTIVNLEQFPQLKLFLGLPITVVIEINGEAEHIISNRFRYKASISEVQHLPTVVNNSDDLASQRIGEPFAIQVSLAGKAKYDRDADYRARFPVLFAGKSLEILSSGGIGIDVSLMEVSFPRVPEVGDEFLVPVVLTDERLLTVYVKDSVLLVPSKQRLRRYNAYRRCFSYLVELAQTALEKEDYSGVRRAFGRARTLPLISSEVRQLSEIIKQLPANEQPVHVDDFRAEKAPDSFVHTVDVSYGVCLETMTCNELKRFAQEVFDGKRQKLNDDLSAEPYLVGIGRDLGLSDRDMIEMALAALEARIEVPF